MFPDPGSEYAAEGTKAHEVAELREWAKSIIPLAKRAYNHKGEYNPGTHCRFCRARAVCRARAKYALNTITNLISGEKE